MRPEDLTRRAAGNAWRHFLTLLTIPRPSGHEAAVRAWLLGRAHGQRWATAVDAAGNLVIRVPGRGRHRLAPPLILQAHLDMVPEQRPDGQHDFRRDPIRAEIAGDWLVAPDTTLGADNGVGIAIALAVAEAEVPERLPLELLFTVEEETGLYGASRLDVALLSGRRLLNLDGDRDGVFVIGCAGGSDLEVVFRARAVKPPAPLTSVVQLAGLRGGHSGVNINEGRGHAIGLASQMLAALRRRCPGLRLHTIAGGNRKNAIPREIEFGVSGCRLADLRHVAAPLVAALAPREPQLRLRVRRGPRARQVLSAGALAFLARLPNGVLAMDPHFPDQVETSNSVGVAAMDGPELRLLAHGRSSSAAALTALEAQFEALARRHGGRVRRLGGYPGWTPNPQAQLLAQAAAVYRRRFGCEPTISTVHAGLEAGIIGAKLGTTELLCCGATLDNAHAPGERLAISSFDRLYAFVLDLVTAE